MLNIMHSIMKQLEAGSIVASIHVPTNVKLLRNSTETDIYFSR